jgi:hypothetical protein
MSFDAKAQQVSPKQSPMDNGGNSKQPINGCLKSNLFKPDFLGLAVTYQLCFSAWPMRSGLIVGKIPYRTLNVRS